MSTKADPGSVISAKAVNLDTAVHLFFEMLNFASPSPTCSCVFTQILEANVEQVIELVKKLMLAC